MVDWLFEIKCCPPICNPVRCTCKCIHIYKHLFDTENTIVFPITYVILVCINPLCLPIAYTRKICFLKPRDLENMFNQ